MAATSRQCTLFTLIYSLAFFWGALILMLVSFHVCIDLPPAKRRRTLAGTIVSGAVNAALIGTAVGLTVYRLYVLSFALMEEWVLIPILGGKIGGRSPSWNLRLMNRVTGSQLG
jgi:hypothetical protein